MPQGIFITVTHTGVTSSAIFLADVYPTTDGHTAFNRAGPVYVPVSGSIVLTYSDTVALSFESGNIRKFIDAGYLTATLSLAGTAVSFPPATGDTSGTYPNLTVTGIQGFPIQNGAGPANGDALLYNSLSGQWEHSPIIFGGGPPVGPAGGDLSGLYPNPGVSGLQTDPLPVAVANGFLKRNAANTGWEEVTYGSGANTVCVGNDARLSDSRTPTGAAGGDLTGTYPNPTIAALAVTDAKVAVANKDGLAAVASMRTLGTGAQQACAGNDARLSDSRAPTGTAGGDLTGTYPNPTLAAVGAAGTYGSSTSIPVVTTDSKGRVTGVVNTPITTLGVGAFPRLGNTVLVDGVNGNDLTGAINGLPVATVERGIALALAAAPTPVTIWIAPGTYTLASATTGLTVPDGCALRGLSVQTTRIVMSASNPGSTVTMLTMGENSRVEDLSLTLSSTNATTNLVGVATPGSTSNTSKLRTAVVTVNNASLAVGTTTNVYGILDAGTGTLGPATFSFNFTRGVTINVLSNGGGTKRGLLVSGPNDITFRDTNIYVAAPTDPASTGSYVGVETTNVDADAEFRTCSISGPSTAGGYTGSDILQTQPTVGVITNKGIQLGPGVDLLNKTAGGKPFTTYVTPTTLIYGLHGNAQNATHYLWPGVQLNSDNTEIFYRFQQKAIVQGMFINMRTAPGVGKSLVFTVRKSTTGVAGSGVATVMTATVSDLNTTGYQYGVSVDFAQGEYLSLQIVGGAGVTAADISVELDIF